MSDGLHVELVEEGEPGHYNDVVKSFPHADLLQSYEWGELKRRTGWRPIRFIVRDDDGTPRAAGTALEKRLPYVKRSFLYAPRGPAMVYDDTAVLKRVVDVLRELALERRAAFVKIDPDVPKPRPDLTAAFGRLGFVPARFRRHWGGIQPVAVCRLPIDTDEDTILAGFRPKTRYNIRLANRKGVTVRLGGRDDLPAFHRIWQETAARQNFSVRGLDHLYQLWDLIIEPGHGALLLAEYDGQTLASVIVTSFGDKAWYLYGGTSNVHRERMPMYLLQWEAIRWAKARGCTLYDFLGVSCHMDPQDPMYGLYRFKRGFNPEYTEFIGEFDLPLDRRFYAVWNRLEPAYLRTMSRVGRARRAAGRALEAAGRGGLGPL